MSNNLQHAARELANNMVASFFLDKGLPERDRLELEREIRASPLVDEVRYVTAEEALTRFQASFPELRDIIANLKTNPFPPSLEARLKTTAAKSNQALVFISAIKVRRGVEDVQFNRDWVEKMQSLSRLARAVGFFLGGILILASFFIISNVIKLNVFARKNEIEILRLVGSTNLFIRIPFFLEGMALGVLGSLLSLALLFLVIQLFPLYVGSSLGALQEILSFRALTASQSAALVAAGGAIGLLGSASSVSRFLRV